MEVGEELKQPGDGSWELGVGEEKSIIDIQSTGLIVTGSSLSPNFDLPTPGFQPPQRPALLKNPAP